MNRTKFVLAVLIAAAIWPAAVVEAALVDQRTQGINRICVYSNPRGTRLPNREFRIGLGEPCPLSLPQPHEVRRPTIVPSMAILESQKTETGARVCSYAYAGRSYERRLPLTQSCPLTPHF